MAKSILLNENWEKDTVFPEKLAKLAKLALAASVKGEEKFTDPDDDTEYEVDEFQTFDYSTRAHLVVPGVSIVHENILWQCFSAGTTRKNQEYFKFKGFCLFIAPTSPTGRILEEPLQIASGQIFHNSSRRGDYYEMQLFDAVATAEIKMARALLDAGISIDKVIKASQTLTRSDLENTYYEAGRRSSEVALG